MSDTPETDAALESAALYKATMEGLQAANEAGKQLFQKMGRERDEARRLLENILKGDDAQDWKEARKASWMRESPDEIKQLRTLLSALCDACDGIDCADFMPADMPKAYAAARDFLENDERTRGANQIQP